MTCVAATVFLVLGLMAGATVGFFLRWAVATPKEAPDPLREWQPPSSVVRWQTDHEVDLRALRERRLRRTGTNG